jgi:menaquinone-dependent protoporphyrinogen oxidase
MLTACAAATLGEMKVLVAYASKRGSTAEIAEGIAEVLRESGLDVDRSSVSEVEELGPYEAIVLGSAVYMKRWRGDARRFLRRHRKEMGRMPFWMFSSGPVGDPEKDDLDWSEPRKVVAAAEKLGVRDHVVFGGRLPTDPQGPIEKAMAAGIPEEYRDRRDWDEIRAWARAVAGELAALAPAP